MTIDSLKELMDGFDPATLLPNLDAIGDTLQTVLTVALMAGPIILLVMGLAYLLVSPKEANYYFGYRCYFGMGSVDAWRLTQKIAGAVWGVLGLTLLIIAVVKLRGFADLPALDMVWSGVKFLLWQVGLVLVSSLAINITMAVIFDKNGSYRRKKQAKS